MQPKIFVNSKWHSRDPLVFGVGWWTLVVDKNTKHCTFYDEIIPNRISGKFQKNEPDRHLSSSVVGAQRACVIASEAATMA